MHKHALYGSSVSREIPSPEVIQYLLLWVTVWLPIYPYFPKVFYNFRTLRVSNKTFPLSTWEHHCVIEIPKHFFLFLVKLLEFIQRFKKVVNILNTECKPVNIFHCIWVLAQGNADCEKDRYQPANLQCRHVFTKKILRLLILCKNMREYNNNNRI